MAVYETADDTLLELAGELMQTDEEQAYEVLREYARQDLRARMKACTGCRLRKSCTQVVPWSGPTAKDGKQPLAFCGEAPGKDEDALTGGMPFVGKSGQVMNAALAQAGLSREEIPFFNVMGCRPWKWVEGSNGQEYEQDRRPKPDEVAACRPWLEEQLSIIDPWMIVCLGGTAAETFWPDYGSVQQAHNKLKIIEKGLPGAGRIVTVTYHPGAVLPFRDPEGERRAIFKQDLEWIFNIYLLYREMEVHVMGDGSTHPAKTCGTCQKMGVKSGMQLLEMTFEQECQMHRKWRELERKPGEILPGED